MNQVQRHENVILPQPGPYQLKSFSNNDMTEKKIVNHLLLNYKLEVQNSISDIKIASNFPQK